MSQFQNPHAPPSHTPIPVRYGSGGQGFGVGIDLGPASGLAPALMTCDLRSTGGQSYDCSQICVTEVIVINVTLTAVKPFFGL